MHAGALSLCAPRPKLRRSRTQIKFYLRSRPCDKSPRTHKYFVFVARLFVRALALRASFWCSEAAHIKRESRRRRRFDKHKLYKHEGVDKSGLKNSRLRIVEVWAPAQRRKFTAALTNNTLKEVVTVTGAECGAWRVRGHGAKHRSLIRCAPSRPLWARLHAAPDLGALKRARCVVPRPL